jgi:hypothetical protein
VRDLTELVEKGVPLREGSGKNELEARRDRAGGLREYAATSARLLKTEGDGSGTTRSAAIRRFRHAQAAEMNRHGSEIMIRFCIAFLMGMSLLLPAAVDAQDHDRNHQRM